MPDDSYNSVYVSIVGKEKDNDNTLKKCKNTIENSYLNLGKKVIELSNGIERDTSIYLVAHGDDPLFVKDAKFGDKTPSQVVEITSKMLKDSGFKEDNKFAGRVVLEGCHSAEFGVDDNTRNTAWSILQQDEINVYSDLLTIEKFKVGEPSFLARFQEALLQSPAKRLCENHVVLGGYLGLGFDGDYTKVGYGKAATHNPVTRRYQNGLHREGVRAIDGSLLYDEENSYQQVRIGQQVSYDSTHSAKAKRVLSEEKFR